MKIASDALNGRLCVVTRHGFRIVKAFHLEVGPDEIQVPFPSVKLVPHFDRLQYPLETGIDFRDRADPASLMKLFHYGR